MATPSYPTYKWWETDDKTKRLYTELLAEKLASPRKPGSSLCRKPSNGKDVGARCTSSPKHEVSAEVQSLEETSTDKAQQGNEKHGRYTFETITIDTLAKYDYIKSPRKRVAAPATSLLDLNDPAADNGGNENANQIRDRLLASSVSSDSKDIPNYGMSTSSNGHYLISQKLNTTRNDKKGLKKEQDKTKSKEARIAEKLDKPSRAKLEEIPEYTSSESSESSADETTPNEKDKMEEVKKFLTHEKPNKETDNKKIGKNDEPLKIGELMTKFQSLCEVVEQLEFKMYEFSDDVQKLKEAMGVKDAVMETNTVKRKETVEPILEQKKDRGISRQPSLTFSDKFNSKALMMRQQSSPRKLLAKPRAFFQAKLPLEAVSKEAAMVELKKNEALNEIAGKIKEQEFSEEEILEILKCAKAKYIDKPNYLEEMGYTRKND